METQAENSKDGRSSFDLPQDNLPFGLNDSIHLYEILGMIETIDYIPTAIPRKFVEQFKLYVDDLITPTVFRLFIYFTKVRLWKSVDLPVGPSASSSLSPSASPSKSPSKSPSLSPSLSPSVSPS